MKTVLKRALCGIMAFVVAAGVMLYFPTDTFPGIASGLTAYAADMSDIEGNGKQESPYKITTAEQLLAVLSKESTNYAILTKDIVINENLLSKINQDSGEPKDDSDDIVCWTPISGIKYGTNLDGNGHTISGLYINESGNAGLYASVKSGSFKNLTISDSFIKGGDNVGALVGTGVNNSNDFFC